MTVNDIFIYLQSIAPFETQESWDNAGFLIGNRNETVTGILLALDVTSDVIEEAHDKKANLIITHHPLIFHAVKNIYSDDAVGKRLILLSRYGISVISMHTNLDKSLVNAVLIQKLGAIRSESVNEYMYAGVLEQKQPMSKYILFVKKALNCKGLRYYDAGNPVYKIACIGGAGDEGLEEALAAGCDTFVTADIRHHVWLAAKELRINLVDADHFNTEDPVIAALRDILSKQFSNLPVTVSKHDLSVIQYG